MQNPSFSLDIEGIKRGLKKSDKRLFSKVLNELDVNAQDCIFIDNSFKVNYLLIFLIFS